MWSCAVCNGRTRIWDWLPDPVLCVGCRRKLEREEALCSEIRKAHTAIEGSIDDPGGSENPGSGKES